MNERIKQLATQATRQYSPTYYTQEWIQGFAELIVRDCLGICKSVEKIDGVAWECTDAIREHFGVEE